MAKSKAHPGFAAVAQQISEKEGISPKRARAIAAAGARHASPAAKRANPHLGDVPGAVKKGDSTDDGYCDSCDRPESQCVCPDCAFKKSLTHPGNDGGLDTMPGITKHANLTKARRHAQRLANATGETHVAFEHYGSGQGGTYAGKHDDVRQLMLQAREKQNLGHVSMGVIAHPGDDHPIEHHLREGNLSVHKSLDGANAAARAMAKSKGEPAYVATRHKGHHVAFNDKAREAMERNGANTYHENGDTPLENWHTVHMPADLQKSLSGHAPSAADLMKGVQTVKDHMRRNPKTGAQEEVHQHQRMVDTKALIAGMAADKKARTFGSKEKAIAHRNKSNAHQLHYDHVGQRYVVAHDKASSDQLAGAGLERMKGARGSAAAAAEKKAKPATKKAPNAIVAAKQDQAKVEQTKQARQKEDLDWSKNHQAKQKEESDKRAAPLKAAWGAAEAHANAHQKVFNASSNASHQPIEDANQVLKQHGVSHKTKPAKGGYDIEYHREGKHIATHEVRKDHTPTSKRREATADAAKAKPNPLAAKEKAAKSKAPHEMSFAEYRASHHSDVHGARADAHQGLIRAAIHAGKNVPEHVMNEHNRYGHNVKAAMEAQAAHEAKHGKPGPVDHEADSGGSRLKVGMAKQEREDQAKMGIASPSGRPKAAEAKKPEPKPAPKAEPKPAPAKAAMPDKTALGDQQLAEAHHNAELEKNHDHADQLETEMGKRGIEHTRGIMFHHYQKKGAVKGSKPVASFSKDQPSKQYAERGEAKAERNTSRKAVLGDTKTAENGNTTIEVPTAKGSKKIKAHVDRGLAIHPMEGGKSKDGHTLTHVASGLKLTDLTSKASAEELRDKFHKTGIDFTKPANKLTADEKQKLVKVTQAHHNAQKRGGADYKALYKSMQKSMDLKQAPDVGHAAAAPDRPDLPHGYRILHQELEKKGRSAIGSAMHQANHERAVDAARTIAESTGKNVHVNRGDREVYLSHEKGDHTTESFSGKQQRIEKGMSMDAIVNTATTGSVAEAIERYNEALNQARQGLGIIHDLRDAEHEIRGMDVKVEVAGNQAVYTDKKGKIICVRPLGAILMHKGMTKRAFTSGAVPAGGGPSDEGELPTKHPAHTGDGSKMGDAIASYHRELNKTRQGMGDPHDLNRTGKHCKELGVTVSIEGNHAVYTKGDGSLIGKHQLEATAREMRRRRAAEDMGFSDQGGTLVRR